MGRDRLLGLLQAIEGVEHAGDMPVLAVFKFQHAEFDDFIGTGIMRGSSWEIGRRVNKGRATQ